MACSTRFFRLRRLVFLALAAVLATGCGTGHSPCPTGADHNAARMGGNELPRANPSYIQWLERQSLVRKSPELTAIVSGSSLPWNAPSTVSDLKPLLDRADLWLELNPHRIVFADAGAAHDTLTALAAGPVPEQLAAMGVRGLWLAPTADSGAAWDAEGSFAEQGRDAVSFAFAPSVGTDQAYAALESTADAAHVLLGGDVLPAATGLGPDFFLAVRGVRDYPGLYMMVEVPQEAWPLLPLSRLDEGGTGRPLRPGSETELARRAIIPPVFARDLAGSPALATPGGWAATPEIVGVDGVNRRWVYRYAGSPRRPVLNWDDPSGAARRVLSASIIRQVGLLHQPVVGLSVEALWGQDPAPGAAAGGPPAVSPEPGLSALRDLSRDVRRYGSRSLLRDRFPARLLPVVQAAGVDFAADTVTSPALEYALLTGDAGPLKQALDASLAAGVDHARLWRALADGSGLSFSLAGLSADAAVAALPEAWQRLLPVRDGMLYAAAPALAAIAAGLTPDQALRAGQDGAGTTPSDAGRILDAHLLQIAFRAMQPGLLMLSGQDLTGALFAPDGMENDIIPPPAWTPDGARETVTRQGLPLATQIYPPLAVQLRQEDGLARRLQRLAALRRETGVARGRLIARADRGDASTGGVLTALPAGDYLLTAGNFSGTDLTTDVRLPAGLIRVGTPGSDLMSGKGVAVDRDHLRLRMAPWQYRLVRLRAAAPHAGGQTAADASVHP